MLKKQTTIFVSQMVFVASAMLASCSALSPPSATKAGRNVLLDGKNANSDLVIVQRPTITDETINSDDLVLSGLGVGLASDYSGSIISVNYSMPKLADYAQIIRCRGNAAIDNLWDLDIGTADRKKAWEQFLTKDYWSKALAHTNCFTATEGFAKQGSASYFDIAAPNGSYRYVARACVNKERFSGKMPKSGFACSAWVGVSAKGTGDYTNTKSEKQQLAAKQQQERRDKIDALGRRMSYLHQKAEIENKKCSKIKSDSEIEIKRRAESKKILTEGIELGAKLATEVETGIGNWNKAMSSPSADKGPTAASDPKTEGGIPNEGTATAGLTSYDSSETAMNLDLSNISGIASAAKSLVGSLDYLYNKPTDFAVPDCPAHLKALEEGNIAKLEIDAAVKGYGDALKTAATTEAPKK
jgi:hypothetical protein